MLAANDAESRARQSLGSSEDAIYRTVAELLDERRADGILADIGCGTGNLSRFVAGRFQRVIGVDVVRYPGLPPQLDFRQGDLDRDPLPLRDGEADAAVAVETIEH